MQQKVTHDIRSLVPESGNILLGLASHLTYELIE